MGRWLGSALGVALLAASVPAQDADKARAIIDRAIKESGGLEKLSLDLAGHRKSKGHFLTEGFRFDGDSYSEPGGKRRLILKGIMDDVPATRVLVMTDPKKGWISYDGVTYDLDAKFLARIERSGYADKVCGLVTLVKDPGYTLSLLPQAQVKGRAAVGVKVTAAGKPDVSMWFDTESGLLVKSANKAIEPSTDAETYQEIYYSDYRLTDPAAADVALLRAAQLPTDGPGLLDYFRRRVPDEGEQVRIKDHLLRLGHKSFAVRQKASAGLKEFGVKAAALLRQAAADPDRETARRAQQALETAAASAELEHTAAAARLLAIRNPRGAADLLLAYYPWAPDDRVRHEVLGALVEIGTTGGKPGPELAAALKGRDPDRRAAAQAALGLDGGAFLRSPWRRIRVEGLRLPMRTAIYRDGVHFMDVQTLEIHFYNRLDESLFTRP